mgnify:CR=1 FL=1
MIEETKLLPIGIENFKEIITEGFYYVDKTKLIKELLNHRAKVTLFTRPRRFGKSLTLSMLRTFFEIGTNKEIFTNLEIAKETALCDNYMGKFPVIAISLKGVSGTDFKNALEMLRHTIYMEISRHQYLMDSPHLSNYDKQILEPFLLSQCSKSDLTNSLYIVSQLLYKHFKQKVVILIDEYDVPLAKAYDYGYYQEMVLFIHNLFERTLKTNENLQFAVLTGCLRIAKESIFTGLNNLKILPITSVKFDEYFGFTDKEVQYLLAYYKLEQHYPIIKQWYNGYKFGNVDIYCPWDVINYVDDIRDNPKMKPQNYWCNTSSNDIIRKFIEKADNTTKYEMEQLIAGELIEKNIVQELTYAELDKTIQHLWSVLFVTGYLTYQPKEEDNDTDTLLLKIPNEEIRSIFKNQIYTWFNDYVQTDSTRYQTFSEAFLQGNAGKVQEMFNQYLIETISIRDTSVRKEMKENFYHGMLLGILKYRNDWIVKSNQESGEGYNDITIIDNINKTGIVIEVKYAENDNLNAECSKAIKQINKLHYTTVLKEHSIVKILKFGIACYKKHCMVVMEEELIL